MNETELSAGLHTGQKTSLYAAGSRVRITQQIPRRTDTYTITVEGTVLRQERQGSGSWFARNKKNKVWLDRLILQKADGEISILNLDEYTHVEILDGTTAPTALSPMVNPSQDASAGVT